jgi:hypothetical protein
MKIKRFAVHRIGIAALAIGTLAAGLVGANALYDATQDSELGAVAETSNISRTSPADTMRFLEWNTNLPASSAEPAQSEADIRFLELNTILPGLSASTVRGHVETRFLEMNVLPGDDARFLPSPSESQPAGTPY